MSPSIVTIDNTPDFDFAVDPAPTTKNGNFTINNFEQQRTLLLAPPSIAAQGTAALPGFDRITTDLQMLDRLSAGLVNLPAATYDLILLLTDSDGARHAEATGLLSREVFASLVPAMKPGALLKTQDNKFGAAEAREAVLAGLVEKNGGGFEKVEEEEVVVPLRFSKKKNTEQNGNGVAHSSAGPAVDKVTINVAGKPEDLDMIPPPVKPVAGVGFDFGDDLDDDDDDDLIDEDELMTEADMNRPIQMPPECKPQAGKKRRACKDCTCGLAERIEAQDKARRAKADQDLNTLKLKSEDLNELDFTVQGKTGSCGSCALGDAFRCSDCPYSMYPLGSQRYCEEKVCIAMLTYDILVGLPPFKPGEEVKILNNVAQF
ncbi:Fe-S cluster assembly protein dre2 [Cytospora mali]|uniref:Fe-S cluster assembly protein dre2 n=1 Tax=Cytospora mali TaxID=578113 RepID=A0A194UUV5_CYTMA|nr:Fe-S cluster assembly protein dre2 [Valsa mali var. pyri (nom. inval.)]